MGCPSPSRKDSSATRLSEREHADQIRLAGAGGDRSKSIGWEMSSRSSLSDKLAIWKRSSSAGMDVARLPRREYNAARFSTCPRIVYCRAGRSIGDPAPLVIPCRRLQNKPAMLHVANCVVEFGLASRAVKWGRDIPRRNACGYSKSGMPFLRCSSR
jgi:hypothetical protein